MDSLELGSTGTLLLKRPIRVHLSDLRTHWHIIGVSGSGKSRFLAGLFLALHKAGIASTLIDPHGDLTRLILGHLVASGAYENPDQFKQLLYLDLPEASRQGLYLPFNVLIQNQPHHTIASNFKESMHRAFPELAQGAPTFDTILPRSIRVLLHHSLPITYLERFLLDDQFRNQLLSDFPDEAVARFFQQAIDTLRASDKLTYVGSVMRRAQQLTDLPVLKYSLGQTSNLLDWRSLMDEGRSALVNLALPEQEAGRLLGCLMTVGLEQAALSRADLPIGSRGDLHYLLIDEFSNFTAQSEDAMSTMLSQTRKYNLFLVAAHQNWSQTSDHLKGALQNAGVELVFRLGRPDAEYTAPFLFHARPTSVSKRHEQGSESEGLREQWEAGAQELQDLPQRKAYLVYHEHHKSHLPPVKPGRKVKKIKVMDVPDATLSADALRHVEAEYLRLYFKSKEEIDWNTDQIQLPQPVAPSRREPR